MKYSPRSLYRNCDRAAGLGRYILRSGVVRNNIQRLYDPLYLPSSSFAPPSASTRQTRKQSQARCALPNTTPSDCSPHPDADPAARGRKRGFSQATSSPSCVQNSARKLETLHTQSRGQGQQHTAQFCTQRFLIGLQQSHQLDVNCPNVMLHRQGGNSNRHLINADMLIEELKQQLDENIDQDCTPMGVCGATEAPFKVTCTAYGYSGRQGNDV
jgi:hypothetical protein